jgi:NitT/TauT family transport system permease protein
MESVVAREALVVPADEPPGTRRTRGAVRKIVLFVLALVLVACAWELYKAVGPDKGGDVFGWSILPRSNDIAMPHVWDMWSRLFEDESRTSDTPIWLVVLRAAWYSFRLAAVGFAIGSAVGASASRC